MALFHIEYRTGDGDLFGREEKTEIAAVEFAMEWPGRVVVTESDGCYMQRQMIFNDGKLVRMRLNMGNHMRDLMEVA